MKKTQFKSSSENSTITIKTISKASEDSQAENKVKSIKLLPWKQKVIHGNTTP